MKKDLGFPSKLVRMYTFYTPFRKGKYRVASAALNLDKELPDKILAVAQDKRRLFVDPASLPYRYVYFLGEYEPAITDIINKIVEPGDVCLDIGANIGWYTTLLQKLVGEKGSVHAFEPVPRMFGTLEQNVKLNEPPVNVTLNNLALGDTKKNVELHIFKDLPDGHSSIATFGSTEYESFSCPMTTLDSYLIENQINQVDFIKMDIEGAELMMLKGAGKLFEQETLPIWEIEMALDTTRGFDYLPNDLIVYIREQSPDYEFYAIDEINFGLRKIEGFAREEKGANVLCFPKNRYGERFSRLKILN